MGYISKSFRFIINQPALFGLFLLFESDSFIKKGMVHLTEIDEFQIKLFGLLISAIFLYLLAGLYAIIWKRFSGQEVPLTSIFTESRQYFFALFIASLIIVGFNLFFMVIPMYIHQHFFYPEMPPAEYGKKFDANLVRSIPSLIAAILYVYVYPYIYVSGVQKRTIFKVPFSFLWNNFSQSKPAIGLTICLFLIGIILTQWSIRYDYGSYTYWSIGGVRHLISVFIDLLIFITAAQIIHKHYSGEMSCANE